MNNGHGSNHNDKEEDFDSEDEEEAIDYEKDEEDDDKSITNKYIVDMIAQYKDQNDELILHWGIGKKVANEWVCPDEKYIPIESKIFHDGKACQTKFVKNAGNNLFRTIHIDF